uniref:Uncharacterized protein n=1 Tax=Caenorhabditis japonica TaxID=281687 RepID=A0A8R1I0P7_CAEJA
MLFCAFPLLGAVSGQSLCLVSDETTKGTKKVQTFGVHSSDGTFVCLGLEQVAEKSAMTAFGALEASVNKLPGVSPEFFKQFMLSVKSTMSDSARTEIKFNTIIEKYRSQVAPEVVENFTELSDEEKAKLLNVSNFFCQLHLVSNFTNVALKSLLQLELSMTGVSRQEEATVLTLIKAVTGAEKNQIASQKSAKRSTDSKRYTADIVRYGFWESKEDVEAGLIKLNTEKLKKEAIAAQLRFRDKVLNQHADRQLFKMSSGQIQFDVPQLTRKLLVLLELDEQPGHFLLLANNELVGKLFIQKAPDSLSSSSSSSSTTRSGFIEDVWKNRRGHDFVTLLYDDDGSSFKMSREDFDTSISTKSIIFI